MNDHPLVPRMSAPALRRARQLALIGLAVLSVTACSSSSNLLGTSGGGGGSLGDRFSQLFGGKSQAVGEASPRQASTSADPAASSFDCPPVLLRDGAVTLAVGASGVSTGPSDVQYQATIARTARECALNAGQVQARVGMQGRIIVGPLGSPPQIAIPLRIAVVREGVSPQTVLSKIYVTQVEVPPGEGNVPFSFVAEDVVFPLPPSGDADAYVFYVGFDPEGLKPQKRAPRRRR